MRKYKILRLALAMLGWILTGGAAQAQFVRDTFTGSPATALTAHTGEVGAAWMRHPAFALGGQAVITAGGQLRGGGNVRGVYLASGSPSAAEYDVEADFTYVNSVSAMHYQGLTARYDTSQAVGYELILENNNTLFLLRRTGPTTQVVLGSAGLSLRAGTRYHLMLRIRNAFKKVLIDGVEFLSSTDNAVSAPGRAGVFWDNDDTDAAGWRIDNFQASNLAAPPPSPSGRQIVFDGNSLTAGHTLPTDQTYPAQLLAILGTTWTGTNFAVNGQTTPQMSADAASQIDPALDRSKLSNVLVAWEIGNDLFFNGISPQQAYNNFAAYCQARRAAGWKVVVLTIPPRDTNAATPTFEADRSTANSLIRANWRSFSDGLADIALDSRIGPLSTLSNTTYYSDRLHFTPTGNGIIADYVASATGQVVSPGQ